MMVGFYRALLASALLAHWSFPLAAASHEAATEQVKVQLIASVAAVHSGDEILLGIHQRIIPHWHTYWKNPGDSGLANKIEYILPDGAEVGEVQWPTPSRITLGPVVNYGYEHEVTLLTPVKLPHDLPIGSSVPIKALAKWLVCEEECIPQEAELSLSLPVIAAGGDSGIANPLIEQAKARLPLLSPWPVTARLHTDGIRLELQGSEFQQSQFSSVWFFPDEWGRISHAAQQPLQIAADGLSLQLKPGDAPLKPGQSLSGLLVLTDDSSGQSISQGYQIRTQLVDGVGSQPHDREPELLLSSAIFWALLGGVVLNLMPCVFPVLSMKSLALIGHASHETRQVRLHGWSYTAGILSSFSVLAGILIALKAGGAQIGWGFQFQSPWFVLLMAYLMFAVGLNLSGVFSIGGSIVGVGSGLAQRGGYSGSFFTGVLATVVATPCTAPFMGAAIGFALTQPPLVLLTVFLSLGLGLALPYLVLSYWPALQRMLPKPGVWMDHLKQGLAFPMYGASAWLVWVLAQQAGVNAVALALAGMVAIGFACWLFNINQSTAGVIRIANAIAALLLVTVFYGSYMGLDTLSATQTTPAEVGSESRNWQAFDREKLQALRAAGKPVFVNFTAAWCISCLVNERVALNQPEVKQALNARGITYLKGDWTNRDAQITAFLAEFGRSGVPLYLYYPPGKAKDPSILPQILTPQIVTQAFVTADVASNSIR